MILTHQIRTKFPFFQKNSDIVFLDTAASSQKPESVIQGMADFYSYHYANIHRGAYPLADNATKAYEQAREKVKNLISAKSKREVVITKGATEGINLIARSLADAGMLTKGDTILLSEMEHHANTVPWLQLKDRIGIHIEYIPFDKDKNLDMNAYKKLLQKESVKLVSITHVSNVLGTVNDVKEVCKIAKEKGVLSLIDGCQAVPHFPVDVQDIHCDFYVFSSHKMYGPTGVGALYGRLELLKKLPPFLGGGDMIHEVFFDSFTPNEVPYRFEAGTPPIAEAYGMGLACDFLNYVGLETIFKHDKEICSYAYKKLLEIPELKIHSHKNSCGLVSFTIAGISDYDIGDELGEEGVCVRVGHHCAQPLLNSLDVRTLIRASFGIYNTEDEIDRFIEVLNEVVERLK
jgi:cysteine desulfurase / selenocysteine lyase